MTYNAIGCKKCKVFISIDTFCGGVSAISLWVFIKHHTHKRGLQYLRDSTINIFESENYSERCYEVGK